MALILPKSVCIHIPKTGGMTWRAALHAAFRTRRKLDESGDESMARVNERMHGSFMQLRPDEKEGRRVIASVRPTLGWYESLWCHIYRHRKDGEGIAGLDFWVDDFEQWILKVCRERPGAYNRTLMTMLGGCSEPILLRFRVLLPDMVTALKLAGEEFDEEKIYRQQPQNVCKQERAQCTWSDEMLEGIAVTEGEGTYPDEFTEQFGQFILTH